MAPALAPSTLSAMIFSATRTPSSATRCALSLSCQVSSLPRTASTRSLTL